MEVGVDEDALARLGRWRPDPSGATREDVCRGGFEAGHAVSDRTNAAIPYLVKRASPPMRTACRLPLTRSLYTWDPDMCGNAATSPTSMSGSPRTSSTAPGLPSDAVGGARHGGTFGPVLAPPRHVPFRQLPVSPPLTCPTPLSSRNPVPGISAHPLVAPTCWHIGENEGRHHVNDGLTESHQKTHPAPDPSPRGTACDSQIVQNTLLRDFAGTECAFP